MFFMSDLIWFRRAGVVTCRSHRGNEVLSFPHVSPRPAAEGPASVL